MKPDYMIQPVEKKSDLSREDGVALIKQVQGEPLFKGGPGSGNFGHAGRPGEVGGSSPGGGVGGENSNAGPEGRGNLGAKEMAAAGPVPIDHPSVSTNAKQIASATTTVGRILKSPDFGMTEEGGNGRAFVKNGEIVLHDPTWIESNKPSSWATPEAWKEGGTYHEYFKTEHGIITAPVPQSNGFNYSDKYGKTLSGYHELRVKVVGVVDK